MKSHLLAATVVAALASAASADITVNMGSFLFPGGEGILYPTITGVTGTLTGFSIDFGFDPLDSGGSWASDALLRINGYQWGGYDVGTSDPDWQDDWGFYGSGSASAGPYSDNRSDIPGGLASPTDIDLAFGNGWFGSDTVSYDNVTVTLFGVSSVPTPGSAALLALGGLTMARRRR